MNLYNCKHYLQRLDFSIQNICSYNELDKVNWVDIYNIIKVHDQLYFIMKILNNFTSECEEVMHRLHCTTVCGITFLL